jgi:hypothetical protein
MVLGEMLSCSCVVLCCLEEGDGDGEDGVRERKMGDGRYNTGVR